MDYKDYNKINLDNIKSLKIVKYTEGGISENTINNNMEISKIYDFFKQIQLLDESKYSCTDNTTIYIFNLKDGSKISIELECNWIVIKGKNYNYQK